MPHPFRVLRAAPLKTGAALAGAVLLGACVSSEEREAIEDRQGQVALDDALGVKVHAPELGAGEEHAVALHFTGTDIGFAAVAGFTRTSSVQAFAGLSPGMDLPSAPRTGSATMSGVYNLIDLENIEVRADGTSSFSSSLQAGQIDLKVDFADRTIGGRGQSSGGRLVIDGTFRNGKVTGTAVYDGISGDMRGLVGPKRTVGAFHGTADDNSRVFSGGFIGAEPE